WSGDRDGVWGERRPGNPGWQPFELRPPAAQPNRCRPSPAHGCRMTDPADRLYERVLVLRCQAGDDAAFAELVRRYGPRWRSYLRKLLGPGGEVEDVLQDAWLDVFRGVPRLADPGAFAAWVYRIARDRAWRLLRRRRVVPGPLPEGELAGDE